MVLIGGNVDFVCKIVLAEISFEPYEKGDVMMRKSKGPKLGVVAKSGEIFWVVKRKRISPLVKKFSFVQILQAVFGLATLIALSSGTLFFFAKEWHASATALFIAFFSMFVLWEIEYRRNNYLESRRSCDNEQCR